MKTISEAMHWRYSTKEFDASKRISEEDIAQLLDILHLAPSSVNLQPWHYIIAGDDAGKARMAKGTQGNFELNKSKVLDCSHVILLASRVYADDAYLEMVLEQEEKDGRFADATFKEKTHQGRKRFLGIHRFNKLSEAHWMSKQVYLSMGSLLLGAGLLGIDAVPMEGIDIQALDKEFGLYKKGYTTVGLVALGYRSDNDINADLPKSRLPRDTVISKA